MTTISTYTVLTATGLFTFGLLIFLGALILIPWIFEFITNRITAIMDVKRSFSHSLWVWKAVRHYARSNPPPKSAKIRSPMDRVRTAAHDLIVLAEQEDMVVRVYNDPKRPLAMGNYLMEYEVYPKFVRNEEPHPIPPQSSFPLETQQ